MTFILEARLDLDEEEQELFEKYRLYEVAVYDSDAREQYAHSAQEHYQSTVKRADAVSIFPPIEELHYSLGNAFASYWHFSAGLTYSLLSAAAFHITLRSLADGQDMESQNLEEILAVSNMIRQSVQYLADYFTLALTFDGRETLHEY